MPKTGREHNFGYLRHALCNVRDFEISESMVYLEREF